MVCCLNPGCQNPLNPDGTEFCLSCGTRLVPSLGNRYRAIAPHSFREFSQTFLAEDEYKSNQLCAIEQLKLPHHVESSYQKTTQLFQAAHRLQQIGQHPQIPNLCDYFELNNYLYLVQQIIPGQSLQQELERVGVFSEAQIWDVLSEVLPILYFVHKYQVVHRNIKPENILRRQSDRKLMLINFGIDRQLISSASRTETSNKFESAPTDTDIDLYDLGVTCLHLLTGINPIYLWAEQDYNSVKNWQQYFPQLSISEELAEVLDKLLQKNPQQYQPMMVQPQELPVGAIVPVLSTPSATEITTTNTLAIVPYNQASIPPAKTTKKQLTRLVIGSLILLLGLVGYMYWRSRRIPTITGHTDEVNTVAFTPDGENFATGSDDRTIKIWNSNSLQEIRTLKGHKNWVYSVAISRDGRTLVSGSKDNTVKIWNLYTGQELGTLRGHKSYVNSVAISPNGQKVASASYDKTVKIWDLMTQKNITLKGHSGEVLTVAISQGGNDQGKQGEIVVSGSTDKTIKVWNLKTGKEIRTLRGHTADVNSLAIIPGDRELVSVSDDQTIKLWNLNTGREIRTLKGHTADVNFVTISPDGRNIATGSDDKTVKVWNLISGENLVTFKGHSAAVWAVAISPNGKNLVSTSEDKTIKMWRRMPSGVVISH